MIEKMLKTTIFFRKEEHFFALKMLRELGILHVKDNYNNITVSARLVEKIKDKIKKIDLILNMLSNLPNIELNPNNDYSGTVVNDIIKKYDRLLELKNSLNILHEKYNILAPWDNFSFDLIHELKQSSIYVYLCKSHKSSIKEYKNKGFIVEIINKKSGLCYFLLVTNDKDLKVNNEHIQFYHETPKETLNLKKVYDNIIQIKNDLKQCEDDIYLSKKSIDKIEYYRDRLRERLEFFSNLDTITHKYDKVSFVSGFIPMNKEESLSEVAKMYGWGILHETPTEHDNPPLILNPPKMLSFSNCLFQFVGMYPGYFEWDISVCFLFFFSVFCGIIIGDAGYGLFFLIICIYLKLRLNKQKKKNDAINLFIIISIMTIIWGISTCSLFGISEKLLPNIFKDIRNFIFGDNSSLMNNRVEGLCFILGGLHLSIARIWRAASLKNKTSFGELGWAIVIWANSFTLIKFIAKSSFFILDINIFLYIIGIPMILIFYVNWKKIENILNLVFGFIGSFSDVLSYIRLFAVWFAGVHIIECFASIADIVSNISPYCYIFSILIMIMAHLLNLGLASIAVLVHAMRLNMLEFSNQMELQWSGMAYKPFKSYNKN